MVFGKRKVKNFKRRHKARLIPPGCRQDSTENEIQLFRPTANFPIARYDSADYVEKPTHPSHNPLLLYMAPKPALCVEIKTTTESHVSQRPLAQQKLNAMGVDRLIDPFLSSDVDRWRSGTLFTRACLLTADDRCPSARKLVWFVYGFVGD